MQYEWTFEGTTPNTTRNSATFTYATVGTKIVSVRAVLSDGRSATASTSVTVPSATRVASVRIPAETPSSARTTQSPGGPSDATVPVAKLR